MINSRARFLFCFYLGGIHEACAGKDKSLKIHLENEVHTRHIICVADSRLFMIGQIPKVASDGRRLLHPQGTPRHKVRRPPGLQESVYVP